MVSVLGLGSMAVGAGLDLVKEFPAQLFGLLVCLGVLGSGLLYVALVFSAQPEHGGQGMVGTILRLWDGVFSWVVSLFLIIWFAVGVLFLVAGFAA